MPTRLRKVRTLRGSRTYGWGRSGQHRAGGGQGGHGKAGWKRHKWSSVIRYGWTISERGFKSTNHRIDRTINIGQLRLKMDRLVSEGYAKQSNGKLEVDLGRAGYDKLLGDGHVKTDQPLRVLVGKSSEKATAKIGEAGGEVILPSKGTEE